MAALRLYMPPAFSSGKNGDCPYLLCVFLLLLSFAFASPARAADTFGSYPAPQAMYDEIFALEKDFSANAKVIEYGKSVQGRPLLAVKISLDLSADKPAAVIAGNIHGNEWIGNRMAMAAAKRLLSDLKSDPWIASMLAKMDFYILPCINPDGYFKTQETLADASIPTRNARKNASRVDLNRNFPLPGKRTMTIGMAGSDDPDHERYEGTAPYSEPETAAVRDFLAAHRSIFAAVDMHSNWATIFPPKCNSGECDRNFKKMCAAGIAKQTHTKYSCVAQRHVDTFTGEMEDALYYDFGVMAVCMEIFTLNAGTEQKERLGHAFWGSNPEDIGKWVENDRDAALAMLEAAFDITGGKPIPPEKLKVEK